jgi:hypothetical protein
MLLNQLKVFWQWQTLFLDNLHLSSVSIMYPGPERKSMEINSWFSLIPKGIKWQRHGSHVGVPNNGG